MDECKKRWRMLRISLLRYLRESKKPSGSSGRKKKPFYLEDAMKYLIPYTKSRHQTGTADSDEEEVCDSDFQLEERQTVTDEEDNINISNIAQKNIEESGSQKGNKTSTPDLVESSPVPIVSSDLSEKTVQGSSSKKRKIQKNTENWENSAVQCLNALSNKYNANTKTKESSDQEDSDLLFLRSLLPDLKKLTDAQKRRFKQRVFALFDDILNEDSVHVPVPFPPPYSSSVSEAVSGSSYDSHLQYSSNNDKQYTELVRAVVFE